MSAPQPPANLQGIIGSYSLQYGVPVQLTDDIIYTESGYNPRAVGDQGTSFGLLQLHIGGQLPAQYNNNPTAVFDPALNLQLGMPAIANAWNNLKSSFNSSDSSWWQNFAAQSGHPGGSPGQTVTNNEAAILQQNYGGASGTPQTTTGDCCKGDFGCEICKNSIGAISNPTICCPGVASQGAQGAAQSIFTPVLDWLKQWIPTVGLFLVGLVMLVIGFVIIGKPA